MWTRRRFLHHSALALAAMSLPASFPARAAQVRGPLGKLIGLQIYTLRDAARIDWRGTFRAIAEIGYGEVELAGQPDYSAAAMRTLLTDCGLTVPSMHASMQDLQRNAAQRIEYAQALGIHYLVCSFPATADARAFPDGAMAAGMTLDDWKWNAEQLNRLGELARKAGVQLAYHNHSIEFRAYEGVVGDGVGKVLAFDELLRLTEPALVTVELDIGWVATAGLDPVAYLRKYAERVALLHVKDVRKDALITNEMHSQTIEVGAGKVDWRGLFAAANPERIRHYFVEQENFERSPLEAVKISFDYLQQLGVQ